MHCKTEESIISDYPTSGLPFPLLFLFFFSSFSFLFKGIFHHVPNGENEFQTSFGIYRVTRYVRLTHEVSELICTESVELSVAALVFLDFKMDARRKCHRISMAKVGLPSMKLIAIVLYLRVRNERPLVQSSSPTFQIEVSPRNIRHCCRTDSGASIRSEKMPFTQAWLDIPLVGFVFWGFVSLTTRI